MHKGISRGEIKVASSEVDLAELKLVIFTQLAEHQQHKQLSDRYQKYYHILVKCIAFYK